MAVLDDSTALVLDRALNQLTAQAAQLDGQVALDVQANRRGGGSRRVRDMADPQA